MQRAVLRWKVQHQGQRITAQREALRVGSAPRTEDNFGQREVSVGVCISVPRTVHIRKPCRSRGWDSRSEMDLDR